MNWSMTIHTSDTAQILKRTVTRLKDSGFLIAAACLGQISPCLPGHSISEAVGFTRWSQCKAEYNAPRFEGAILQSLSIDCSDIMCSLRSFGIKMAFCSIAV